MTNFGPYGSTGYNNAYGYFPVQGYQYQPQQNFQVNQNQVPNAYNNCCNNGCNNGCGCNSCC